MAGPGFATSTDLGDTARHAGTKPGLGFRLAEEIAVNLIPPPTKKIRAREWARKHRQKGENH